MEAELSARFQVLRPEMTRFRGENREPDEVNARRKSRFNVSTLAGPVNSLNSILGKTTDG
jgi:hypothetical protein